MAGLDQRFPRYNWFLNFYPPTYQKQYREQMLLTLADMLDDQTNGKTVVWLSTAIDLPLSLVKQNVRYVGDVMAHQMPNYVKRNSLIGAILVSPFFLFIIVNSLTNHMVVFTHTVKYLFLIFILGLPTAAMLLSFITFIKWSAERKAPIWKNLLDLRHNWPMLFVGGLAFLIVLFIPFHDSTHCLLGNPIKEVRNLDQTLHCIQNG